MTKIDFPKSAMASVIRLFADHLTLVDQVGGVLHLNAMMKQPELAVAGKIIGNMGSGGNHL